METLWQDIKYGLRTLLKQPGFTTVAVLTLALGIGANTAIFSVVNAVLLRPLPYKDAQRLMLVWETYRGRRAGVTAPDFKDWSEQQGVFEPIAGSTSANFNLTGTNDPVRLSGARVSASYFPALGVQPGLGHMFTAEQDQPGAARVALLSYGLWQERFGSDRGVLGRTIILDDQQYTMIGVMPAELQLGPASPQVWVPLALTPRELAATGSHRYRVMGRLKPGVTREQAEERMKAIAEGIVPKRPHSNTGISVMLLPLQEQVVGDVRGSLLILLGAVGLVLLVACANVANLMLARAVVREREIAVRAALGAGRVRLLRQLLTESVLLAFVGGALGLLLARWGADALVATLPDSIPRLTGTGIDATVLGFTLAIAVTTGIVFGLAPALQASRVDLNNSLKEGSRGTGASAGQHRLRSALVVSEIALAVVLLIGAGLLIKSFIQLQAVQPGFRPEGLISMRLALPVNRYAEPAQVVAFYRQALERVGATPGGGDVALTSHLPLDDSGFNLAIFIEGRPSLSPGEAQMTFLRLVSPEYFRVLGAPLRAGRGLDENDREGSVRVGVVNQTMARLYWPNESPLGKRFTMDDNEKTPVEVVGVIGDVKHFGLDSEPRPELFVPFAQAAPTHWNWIDRSLNVVVRTHNERSGLISAVRQALWSVDRNLPIYRVTTLEQVMAESVVSQRVYMRLLGLFAGLAGLLAAVGIYGVMSYAVMQHTHDIGVRLALGARPGDVLTWVLSRGLRLTLLGVVLGLGISLALTRVLRTLLFEVSVTDPAMFAGVAILLTGVAALACWVPARRAARVDPMVALRYE